MLPPYWRWRPIPTAVLLVVVLVAVLDRAGYLGRRAGGDYNRYHDRTFPVTHVADGDTLDVGEPDDGKPATRIRLIGVDTPEVAGSRDGEMYFGPEASAFTKQLARDRLVRLELPPSRPRDKYQRLLAYVYLADTGEMLNEQLLKTGHAYADTRFDHPRIERFRDLEEKARKAGEGLWKAVTVEQMPPWRRQREGGR